MAANLAGLLSMSNLIQAGIHAVQNVCKACHGEKRIQRASDPSRRCRRHTKGVSKVFVRHHRPKVENWGNRCNRNRSQSQNRVKKINFGLIELLRHLHDDTPLLGIRIGISFRFTIIRTWRVKTMSSSYACNIRQRYLFFFSLACRVIISLLAIYQPLLTYT